MWTSFLTAARADLRRMLPFHGFVLAYTALVVLAAASQDKFALTAYQQYAEQLGPLFFLALPVVLISVRAMLGFIGLHRPTWQGVGRGFAEFCGRLASAALTITTFILFLGSFTTFKTLMPVLMGGFPYDHLQADIDSFLHGGVDPGPALLNLLGDPLLLQALRWNYAVVWMAFTFVPVFFIAVMREAEGVRLRYFLSFAFVWTVLGSLLACLFLSAGPAFYAFVTGDAARFGPQLQVLLERSGPTYQPYLWQSYLDGTVGLGTGISAFPSVHVGAAMMNALFLRETNRIAGFFGFAYVAVIAVSSVLLGWHYAIDGYVSIAVVWLLHSGLKRALGGGKKTAKATILITSPIPATP
ncbi:phosphatase PAP2 family protein [Shinella kummerowiae]|uniref:phosphatase PAP2 family protein n=1 Tax=Shinella kummerowiae TaxID=417745 RepID=UPI0021B67E2B|nr:phosphatase PAP2 family protein [Shinella kummerowiae]MCT7662821.1 phosphatase PAP2 family protein [Shinella kummerowiae]